MEVQQILVLFPASEDQKRRLEEKLSGLLRTAEGGRLLREGIRTAIAGPPS